MMSSQDVRPRWWQLYLAFPLLIALFVVDNRLKISTRWHQAVQIGIILLVYGLIHLWLKSNGSALSKMDRRRYHGTIMVIRVPPAQLPEANNKPPMLQFPDLEIKGVLSDTFEMDAIDAEFLPIEEVPQELNKE